MCALQTIESECVLLVCFKNVNVVKAPCANAWLCVCVHSFYATEAGRQHFSNQLTSIRYW